MCKLYNEKAVDEGKKMCYSKKKEVIKCVISLFLTQSMVWAVWH